MKRILAVRGVPCIFLENEEGSAFPHYHTPAEQIINHGYLAVLAWPLPSCWPLSWPGVS